MKGCRDYYEQLGWKAEPGRLSVDCCPSCHEDVDSGYSDLIEAEEGGALTGMVCCTVSIALEQRGK